MWESVAPSELMAEWVICGCIGNTGECFQLGTSAMKEFVVGSTYTVCTFLALKSTSQSTVSVGKNTRAAPCST